MLVSRGPSRRRIEQLLHPAGRAVLLAGALLGTAALTACGNPDPVGVGCDLVAGDLVISEMMVDPVDADEGREWFDHIRANPNVRVRFGDTVYPVTAVLVGKPGELGGFDSDRYIYRLDSRRP